MRLVDLTTFTEAEEDEIIGEEREPWGGGPAEELEWAESMQRYVVLLDERDRPAGVVAARVADVEVAGERFPVVGVSGLIVTAALRRQGRGRLLMERLLERAPGLGPERAMLFCLPARVDRYRRHGFAVIDAPVFAEQPNGRIEMPILAMWRPLREGVAWPPGRVDVLGLPF